MAEEVRICTLKGLGGTIEMSAKQLTGTDSPGPRYSGPFAPMLNLFLGMMFGNDRLNYTTVLKTSMGNYNATSGYYDEDSCLYSMQTNQSDLGIASLRYPVEGKHLKSHPFYWSDTVKMISQYRVLSQTYDSDVMGVFAYAFTHGVWLTVGLSCLVFWFITKLHLHMRNKFKRSKITRDDSLYEILSHLFQVETIDYKATCMKLVSLFASVLSFVVIVHFTCSMKTDIVVVQEPDLINSYDDLITKPNIRLMFSGLSDTFSAFESADPQSKERRAFERSLKFVGGDRSQMIVNPAGMDILELMEQFRQFNFEKNRRSVACILDNHVRVGMNMACYLKVLLTRSADAAARKELNFYTWLSQDPDAKETILTLAYSASYNSPYLEKIHKRMKLTFAMGFEKIMGRFANILPVDDKMKDREEGDTFRNCLADDYHRNLPHVEFASFAPVQFKALSITCGVLLVLSVAAHVREKYNKKPKHLKFKHNKVAVAGQSGVTHGQSVQPGEKKTPSRHFELETEIEMIDQEEKQHTLNVQLRVEVAPSIELFYKRSNSHQECGVEWPLNNTGQSGIVHRSDQSVQSRWKNATWRQKKATAIEVFGQGIQDTSSGQARVELASSMNFSSRKSDFDAEMWRQIRSKDQKVKWKVTRV